MAIKITLEQGFYCRVKISPYTDCHIWDGQINPAGYGVYRGQLAHRIAWRLKNGPIYPGLFICHECNVRHCVNPEHLYAGTHIENMQDVVREGRNRAIGDDIPVDYRGLLAKDLARALKVGK